MSHNGRRRESMRLEPEALIDGPPTAQGLSRRKAFWFVQATSRQYLHNFSRWTLLISIVRVVLDFLVVLEFFIPDHCWGEIVSVLTLEECHDVIWRPHSQMIEFCLL